LRNYMAADETGGPCYQHDHAAPLRQ